MAQRKQEQGRSASRASVATVNVPLSMSEALDAEVERVAGRCGLNKQTTMRLAIERGLVVLEQQLTAAVAVAESA
jgi:hypothetical protein